MKRILSFLLCIVFLKAQVLAHTGGPDSAESENIAITGTYSGVLIPKDEESATPAVQGSEAMNSLGIFTVGMPSSGLGDGTFLIFTQGTIFSGTMTAVGDPGKGSVSAIIEGFFTFTDFVRDANGDPILVPGQGFQTQEFAVPLRGTLEASVENAPAGDPLAFQTSNFGRISGTAELGVFIGNTVDRILRYKVDGVKQSVSAGTTAVVGQNG